MNSCISQNPFKPIYTIYPNIQCVETLSIVEVANEKFLFFSYQPNYY